MPGTLIPLASGRCFRIEVDEDVIVATLSGEGDTPDVDEYVAALMPILKLRAPARVLTDATELDDLTMRARWAYAQRMAEHRHLIAKSAVIGLSSRMETVIGLLIRASGRSDLRLFPDRAQAMAWLHEGATQRPRV